MDKYAKNIGYAVSLLVLSAFLALIWGLKKDVLTGPRQVVVRFPVMGTLMEDDAVVLKGVSIGRVAGIEFRDGESVAMLELYRKTFIPSDSRFLNFNYSLFGARQIVVVAGTSERAMDNEAVQTGYFINGVTETIHKVDELLRIVQDYTRLSHRLEKGTDSSMSLHRMLSTRVYPLNEKLGNLTTELGVLEAGLDKQLTSLSRAGEGMQVFSKSLRSNMRTSVGKTQETLDRLTVLLGQTTVVLYSLEGLMANVQDTSKVMQKLAFQRDTYDQALQLNKSLQTLLRILREDGVQDAISLWRNINIRGGHPSKIPRK